MHKKHFNNWNLLKKALEQRDRSDIYFEEREIWYCSIGVNIGHEQDGKNKYFERPVIIFRKFNTATFWGIPITSKKKSGKMFFSWKFIGNEESTALFGHLRSFDSKRLQRKVTQIPQPTFNRISQKIRRFLKEGEIKHLSPQ